MLLSQEILDTLGTGIELGKLVALGAHKVELKTSKRKRRRIIVKISIHKKIQGLEELGSMIIHRVKRRIKSIFHL